MHLQCQQYRYLEELYNFIIQPHHDNDDDDDDFLPAEPALQLRPDSKQIVIWMTGLPRRLAKRFLNNSFLMGTMVKNAFTIKFEREIQVKTDFI